VGGYAYLWAVLASAYAVLVNLGGLGCWFVLMLNHRAIGCWWMVILNCRAILASMKVVWMVLGGLRHG